MSGFKGTGIIPGFGAPTFFAPAGTVYARYDLPSSNIDRLYIAGGSGNFADLQLSDGASHQYNFNETAGVVLFDTGSSLSNGSYTAPIIFGDLALCSGMVSSTNLEDLGYATLPFKDPPMAANGAFSVEMLWKPSRITSFPRLVSNDRTNDGFPFGFQVLYATAIATGVPIANSFYFHLSTTAATIATFTHFPIVIVVGQIYHVVATYDGSDINIYINGVLGISTPYTGNYVPGHNNISFSRDTDSPVDGDDAPGDYQCAAFYPFSLTQAQITNHFNSIDNFSPIWRDVQAITVFNSSGLFAGIFSTVEFGSNITFSINGETVSVNSPPGVTFSGSDVTSISAGSGISASIVDGDLLLSSGSGLEITDGTTTVDGLNVLTVNNLNLQATAATPIVVRRTDYNNTTIAQFPTPPSVGNYLVLIGFNLGAPPSGFSVLTSFSATFPNEIIAGFVTVGMGNPSFTVANAGHYWSLYEVSGVAPSGIVASSGSPIISGKNATFNGTATTANSLSIWGTVDSNATMSNLLPTGTVADYSAPANFYLHTFHSSIPGGETPVFGYTFPTAVNAVMQITLPGIASGNAEITPSIPVEINGVSAGSFQSMVITTGNASTTASLSAGVLTLALGTP